MARFEIFYPVKPWTVSQVFGVNPQIYSQFGINGHNGIDIVTYHGQPVYAAHDGDVTYAGMDGKEGVGVVITSDRKYEYDGGTEPAYIKSIYWHLINNVQVKVGQYVRAGTLIGYADNTGFSTGDHLHFAIKPVAQGENAWTWENVAQNNGFKGAIDPAPYFNKFYAKDAQLVINTLQTIVRLLKSFLGIA